MNVTCILFQQTASMMRYEKKDEKYVSSRKDGSGIGLSSIRITAEKYNGTARFSHDDKVFYIDVVMEV